MSPEQLAHVADFCGYAVVTWTENGTVVDRCLMAATGEMLGSSLDRPGVARAVCRRMLARFEGAVAHLPDAAERVALARMLAAPPMRQEVRS